ncbi:MAG TPA: hypothetical protein PL048_17800 [Leptospiraceae bacterium]|nr:hypothetical protein [Leptospiraceae bacterium]HMY66626.1 hypothetical protein [Leptospiraceae bacterium]HMZ60633.1 hypothetical protein [Leptospiraceae bacterium]HNF15542.1 hypothetical protein [Leptospiraceae bacterium]HNF22846.1 hypothetical protein [Leptospiraceae bacterium]
MLWSETELGFEKEIRKLKLRMKDTEKESLKLFLPKVETIKWIAEC